MSTLGLDDAPSHEDNIFKRIFWPGNQPYEVDSLGQQGLWVCIVVAVVSLVGSVVTGHPLVGLLFAAFYWMGGMGVREGSIAAAVIVAAGYIAAASLVVIMGRPPGVLDIAITIVLLANIRGTWIAASWKKRGAADMFPDRIDQTWTDKLIDQWPPKFWPNGQYAFYVVTLLVVVLMALSGYGLSKQRARMRQIQQIELQQLQNGSPDQ
jgi:hypothetical protein